MKSLWAPWRMSYISQPKEKGCLFCKKPKEKRDQENLILHRGRHAFIMMNRFPYNNGHLMIIPSRHCAHLEQLKSEETRELFSLLQISIRGLKRSLQPDGFNLGMNLGETAGAGIDHHIHFHVVPRWSGDTNFMPILGEVKVVPDHLENTYRRLRQVFADLLHPTKGRKGAGRK